MTAAQEKQIAALMKLGNTREEAIETLRADDEGVETEEMKEMAKKAKANGVLKTGAKSVNAYGKKVVRERKPDEDKREIVQILDDALCDLADNVTLINPERQVDFELNGKFYSVTLTQHRVKGNKEG